MKRLILAGFALLALGACSSKAVTGQPAATSPATTTSVADTPTPAASSPPPVTATPAAAKPKPKPPPAPTTTAPEFTAAQQQAIGAAQDYLSMGEGFSRAGLIDQLSSQYGEGFSKADATFAVDHIQVNWNAQAVLSAKSYLALQHFSRAGLIEQLSSPYGDQYTVAQATYAADHVGL